MGRGRQHSGLRLATIAAALVGGGTLANAQSSPRSTEPRFVEIPCTRPWGVAPNIPPTAMRCGTVVVPQNRRTPHDAGLLDVVLPVTVYALPGARGTPLVFLAGGPGESSIDAVQQVFLKTTTGQLAVRERPIIAFDRRGYSPVFDRTMPDLGSMTFQPRAPGMLAALRDSLAQRRRDLLSHGVDPANFSTVDVVDDIADVARALHFEKVLLIGASYGTREALRFMQRHPKMVEAAILDGVAPPNATQLLDSAYLATSGRAIVSKIVSDCGADPACAADYGDLPKAVSTLASGSSPLRRTVLAPVAGDWRTVDVNGPSVLSVLGVAAAAEEIMANVPRIIVDFVGRDTLVGEVSPRVLFAATRDPKLETVTQSVPLVYWIALCGDRPQGSPTGGSRQLCDALGVPFGGPDAIATISSDIPTLLISSGYDALTPADLADSAAKTLTRAQRVHFPNSGHVAFAQSMVSACAATVIESFVLRPDQAPPAGCINSVARAFAPRDQRQVVGKRQ